MAATRAGCTAHLTRAPRGNNGFGYDPIFVRRRTATRGPRPSTPTRRRTRSPTAAGRSARWPRSCGAARRTIERPRPADLHRADAGGRRRRSADQARGRRAADLGCGAQRGARRRPVARRRDAAGRCSRRARARRRHPVAGARGRRGLRRPDAAVAEGLRRRDVRHQRQAALFVGMALVLVAVCAGLGCARARAAPTAGSWLGRRRRARRWRRCSAARAPARSTSSRRWSARAWVGVLVPARAATRERGRPGAVRTGWPARWSSRWGAARGRAAAGMRPHGGQGRGAQAPADSRSLPAPTSAVGRRRRPARRRA